mmetsp:Transcript_20807/g.32097  ORF Transcript_20807/g.32097 Transcript_20807/m.32097 type:complete len:262 (-) Transcript_20807:270-1055(-)
MPHFLSLLEHGYHVGVGFYLLKGDPCDFDSGLIFTNLNGLGSPPHVRSSVVDEKIHNLLIVNFKVRRLYSVFLLFELSFIRQSSIQVFLLFFTVYLRENLLKATLHKALLLDADASNRLALDCICLSGSGLSIGEDRSIVAGQAALRDGLRYLVEELLLTHGFVSNVVEVVLFRVHWVVSGGRLTLHQDRVALVLDRQSGSVIRQRFLAVVQWANPDANLDAITFTAIVTGEFRQVGVHGRHPHHAMSGGRLLEGPVALVL